MRLYQQAAISLAVLAVGAGAWLFLAPDGREVLARLDIIDGAPASSGPPGGFAFAGGGAVQVVTHPAETGKVNDRLTAIGDGKALQSVTLTPEQAGTVTDVKIESGEHVKKGELLIQLDQREQVLARDQAEVALQSAQRQAEVNRRIKNSISDLELYKAEIAERSAKLDLDAAELDLTRRQVTAPFDGVAGIIVVNSGDYVTTSTELMTIDDRSAILVDFAVPERFAATIKRGQPVEARPISASNRVFNGVVQAVDNRIDAASRTFTVRARIDNPDDALRAGMSFRVTMHFAGDDYTAVRPLAIQWDSSGAYIWVNADGKAEKRRVAIVQRNPDFVLVDGEVETGDEVIVEGIQRLRDGVDVRMASEAAASKQSS